MAKVISPMEISLFTLLITRLKGFRRSSMAVWRMVFLGGDEGTLATAERNNLTLFDILMGCSPNRLGTSSWGTVSLQITALEGISCMLARVLGSLMREAVRHIQTSAKASMA